MSSSAAVGPGVAPPSRGRAGATVAERLWIASAIAAAVALGIWIGRDPTFLHIEAELNAVTLGGLGLGLAVALLVVRFPGAGLVVLLAAVYLNLSQVLVRHHGLPSYLQLIALPLLLGGLLEWRERSTTRGIGTARRPAGALVPLSLLALHVLAVLLSTTVAVDRTLADERLTEAAKGLGIAVLVVLLVTSRARLRVAAWTLLAAGGLLAGLALVQAATGDFSGDFGGLARVKHAHIHGSVFQPRIAGPLGDPNYFAQILLVLVPLALFLGWEERSRRLRALAFGAAGALVAATVLTYSRGGALALGAVLFAALLVRGINFRRLVVGVAVVVLAGALLPRDFSQRIATVVEILPGQASDVLPEDSSFQERLLLAGVAWEMFRAHPVAGVGAGNYAVNFDDYVDRVGSAARDYGMADEARYPHNLYLELGAEGGMVSLLTFFLAVGAVLAGLHHARLRFARDGDAVGAGIATALAIGIGGYLISSVFLHGHHQRYLWLLLGLGVAIHALAPERRRTLLPPAVDSGGGR